MSTLGDSGGLPDGPVGDALRRAQAIADGLPEDDGLRVFLDVYLAVTRAVLVDAPPDAFEDPVFLDELGVTATRMLLAAVEADGAGQEVAHAWRPLLRARGSGRIALVQFALAGMNAHINHDLPIGVVAVMEAEGLEPNDDTPQHRDYQKVDEVFSGVVEEVKARLRDPPLTEIDEGLGRLDDVLALWSVDVAREAAWTNSQTLWQLRAHATIRDSFVGTLDRFTGLASRALLVPTL